MVADSHQNIPKNVHVYIETLSSLFIKTQYILTCLTVLFGFASRFSRY